jgi:N utilization substance protein A
MKLTFDTDTIRLITLFENITHAPVKDCLVDNDANTIYFIVEEGKIGVAIGKNGNNVRHAERVIGKTIKIFEFSKDIVSFVKKTIPQATSIKVRDEGDKVTVEVRVGKKNRPLVIGRGGRNLRIYKEMFKRNYKVDDLSIR